MAHGFADVVFPRESRALLAWAAASATLGLMGLAVLQRAPWVLSPQGPGTTDYLAIAAGVAITVFAITWFVGRLGGPIWFWLGPAGAAAWSVLSPLVVFGGYGFTTGLERLEASLMWTLLAPPLALAGPAVLAARLSAPDWGSLLPADNRRTLAGLAAFSFGILIVNGIAAELANGGFAWAVGALRDDQGVAAFFVANAVGPLAVAFVLAAMRIAPPGAWLVVVVPSLAYTCVGLLGGSAGEFLMYVVFLLPLAIAAFIGSAAGSWVAARRAA